MCRATPRGGGYAWIFLIVFSATTRTGLGIGWKSSFGPKVWPFVTAQKRNFLSSGAFEELSGRGVVLLQEPTERQYGIEAVFRDDSGNWFSLNQRR